MIELAVAVEPAEPLSDRSILNPGLADAGNHADQRQRFLLVFRPEHRRGRNRTALKGEVETRVEARGHPIPVLGLVLVDHFQHQLLPAHRVDLYRRVLRDQQCGRKDEQRPGEMRFTQGRGRWCRDAIFKVVGEGNGRCVEEATAVKRVLVEPDRLGPPEDPENLLTGVTGGEERLLLGSERGLPTDEDQPHGRAIGPPRRGAEAES